MALVPMVKVCGSNGCPAVYVLEDGDLAVQGYKIAEPQVEGGVPVGEYVVRVPRQLLDEYAASKGR